MTLDFSRSAPPCDGPLNIARSTAIACCYVALKHIFTDVPANAGCLAPIDFVIPDTTLLGVSAPRPVGGYTETILRVIDVIFGAFAKVAPERANGSPFATINALSLAGWREHRPALGHVLLLRRRPRRQSGERRTQSRQQPDLDRDHSAGRKSWKSLYPVMFTQWALRPDSGGAGQHRGGLGAIYEIEALADGGADVFLIGERGKFPPFGVNGGEPAALNRFVYETDGGERDAAAGLQDHRRQDPRAARRCGWRRRAAAASAIRRRAIRRASPATCGSATSRARPRARDYGVVLRDDGSRRRRRDRRRRAA